MPNFPHNDFLPTASVVVVVGSKSGTNRREVFSRYLHSKGKEKRAISWQNILWILIIVAMTTTREGKKEIPHSWPSYLCTNDSIWLLLLCSSQSFKKDRVEISQPQRQRVPYWLWLSNLPAAFTRTMNRASFTPHTHPRTHMKNND